MEESARAVECLTKFDGRVYLRPLPGGMSVLQKYDRAHATELMSSDENVPGSAQEKGTEGVTLHVVFHCGELGC